MGRNRDQELALLDAMRMARGIIFTNGVFDILTPGHARFFKWLDAQPKVRYARNAIIVGMNSDESVKRLKGPTRPVNVLIDRMEVLTTLSMVDMVLPFSEDTPEELIKLVKPDLLVKGGDYKGKMIVGEEFVLSYGGKVLKSGVFAGPRTTDLLEKLQ